MPTRHEESLARREPKHTPIQENPQATTNDFVMVAGQTLPGGERNRITFIITETGGANAIDARLVGRVKSKNEDPAAEEDSAWQVVKDAGGADITAAIAAGASGQLVDVRGGYDEYGVEVESNVDGSHGAATVHGSARSVN